MPQKTGKMLAWIHHSMLLMRLKLNPAWIQAGLSLLVYAPVTPPVEVARDEDVDIPSVPVKHKAESSLPGERAKAQRMDDDPVPVPKLKASKHESAVNQVNNAEITHNDELGFLDDYDEYDGLPDSEDEYIWGQSEGQGPPDVSETKLKELDKQL